MRPDLVSRKAAFDVLQRVIKRGEQLDAALDVTLAHLDLSSQDRAFVRMLITTTLRRFGQIDAILETASARPRKQISDTVWTILQIGATQILFMNVADYAAVDLSVRLAKSQGEEKAAGFVNGILRKLTRERETLLGGKASDSLLNIPEWIRNILEADYGSERARSIAEASLVVPPLDLTLRQGLVAEEWAVRLQGEIIGETTVRLRNTEGSVRDLPGYEDGDWWVQDVSATLPVRLFGNIQGRHLADLCAAPGGKTLQMADRGAMVTAIDSSEKRLVRVHENLERVGMGDLVTALCEDAKDWTPATPMRGILLDAPCTATGTIRRNPDVLRSRSESDLKSVIQLQSTLLNHAASILSPGGTLVYCVCSLFHEEGERQIAQFLEKHSEFSIRNAAEFLPSEFLRCVSPDGTARILPDDLPEQGGADGFFMARLDRKK